MLTGDLIFFFAQHILSVAVIWAVQKLENFNGRQYISSLCKNI